MRKLGDWFDYLISMFMFPSFCNYYLLKIWDTLFLSAAWILLHFFSNAWSLIHRLSVALKNLLFSFFWQNNFNLCYCTNNDFSIRSFWWGMRKLGDLFDYVISMLCFPHFVIVALMCIFWLIFDNVCFVTDSFLYLRVDID